MYVYSLSTEAGDCLLDSEDQDTLFAALTEGAGLRLALAVDSALRNNLPEVAEAMVRNNAGITLSIDKVEVEVDTSA